MTNDTTQIQGDIEASPPEAPSLISINSHTSTAGIDLKEIDRELTMARRRFASHTSLLDFDRYPESHKAIVDEQLAPLANVEEAALHRLEEMRTQLLADVQALDRGGWRRDLLSSEEARLPTELQAVAPILSSGNGDAVRASLESAILHRDKARLAAFIELSPNLNSRDLGKDRFAIEDLLARAREIAGDRSINAQIERTKERLQQVDRARLDLVQRRNAHADPAEKIGGPLDRYEFGQRGKPTTSKRYDPQALRIRAGRDSAA